MVDVGDKAVTQRVAVARGFISLNSETIRLVRDGQMKKGDVLTVAKIAGIAAAKNCGLTIPLCHNIFLSSVAIEFNYKEDGIEILSTVKATAKTGVEMEALSAVSTCALTIYDMVKAVDKSMVIGGIMVLEKRGGKSGTYVRE